MCISKVSRFLGSNERQLNYWLGLEMEGVVDGYVLANIWELYRVDGDEPLAATYSQHTIDLEYAPIILRRYELLVADSTAPRPLANALVSLLDAEQKGLGTKDDRILDKLIEVLVSDSRNVADIPRRFRKFQSKAEMILHYCDVLIQRRSPRGYYQKGQFYCRTEFYRLTELPDNQSIVAVSVWEEVGRLGLADYDTYRQLYHAYMYVLYFLRSSFCHVKQIPSRLVSVSTVAI